MVAAGRSVLVVGVPHHVFDEVTPILNRAHFFTEFIATGREALDLMSLFPYDAVVLGFPLPDVEARPFLSAVRKADCPSRNAAVVLLAGSDALEDAEVLVGYGANRVLAVDTPAHQIEKAIATLTGVAPRLALRAISRVKVEGSRGTKLVLCQTENISATGMLLRTDQEYPVGTEFAFELALPGVDKPIRGRAQVVRNTLQRRERIAGVGVRFSQFEGSDAQRFAVYLDRLAS
jgi:CheY-like chemotaxis protein